MQMRLPLRSRSLDSLFQNILRLLHKLSMQIDRVLRNATRGIVLAEDIL